MEFETDVLSEEMQEVAVPAAEDSVEAEGLEGVEGQEVTEPVSMRTDADAAFARMRREREELSRQLEEERQERMRLDNALGLYFQGDNKIAEALAYYQGKSVEQVEAEMMAQSENERLRQENECLRDEMIEHRAELRMREDLESLRRLDPGISSIDEMGETFLDLRLQGGLSVEDAYFAVKAKREATGRTHTPFPGKVDREPGPRDFLSVEEVRSHGDDKEWIYKNYDVIKKSMSKW